MQSGPSTSAPIAVVAGMDRDDVLRELIEKSENATCFDCTVKHPNWASATNGVFLCIECCGKHRAFGVHISFVRSVTLDKWRDEHLATMICGGHARLRSYVAANPALAELKGETFYSHPLMVEYRKTLFLDSRRRLGIDGQRILDDAEADRKKWANRPYMPSSSSSSSASPASQSRSASAQTLLAPVQKEPGCCGCF